MIGKKNITGTIRLLGKVKRKELTLTLIPVGRMRDPINRGEMAQVIITVLQVLEQLHLHGWCHCDLRWPNIIFLKDSPILIDFEYARKIRTPGPTEIKMIKTKDPQIQVRHRHPTLTITLILSTPNPNPNT